VTGRTARVPPTGTDVEDAARVLAERLPFRPRVAVVLGSGLGRLVDELAEPTSVPFEELANVVERLESGELSLEDALRAYERGVALVGACNARLQAAELRIRELRADARGMTESELDFAGEEE